MSKAAGTRATKEKEDKDKEVEDATRLRTLEEESTYRRRLMSQHEAHAQACPIPTVP